MIIIWGQHRARICYQIATYRGLWRPRRIQNYHNYFHRSAKVNRLTLGAAHIKPSSRAAPSLSQSGCWIQWIADGKRKIQLMVDHYLFTTNLSCSTAEWHKLWVKCEQALGILAIYVLISFILQLTYYTSIQSNHTTRITSIIASQLLQQWWTNYNNLLLIPEHKAPNKCKWLAIKSELSAGYRHNLAWKHFANCWSTGRLGCALPCQPSLMPAEYFMQRYPNNGLQLQDFLARQSQNTTIFSPLQSKYQTKL